MQFSNQLLVTSNQVTKSMFAQALKFKQKYYIAPEIACANNNSDIYSEVQLLEAKKLLLKNKSFAEAKNHEVKAEYIELQNRVHEFLLEYFEKTLKKFEVENFSEVNLIPSLSTEYKFDEVKNKSLDFELKNIFKKIAKLTHPDINHSSAEIYLEAQKYYDAQDIENLYYLYNQITAPQKTKNIVVEIEALEKEIIILKKSTREYSEKLDDLINSKEYSLFLKFKHYELIGVDFYKMVTGNLVT